MTSHSDDSYFVLAGRWLGYPECCIQDFLLRFDTYNPSVAYVKRPLHGTGFVPCPICSATYTDEELIAKIEANRKCPLPFPQADPKMVREHVSAVRARSPA
jgi:hypothetical protein